MNLTGYDIDGVIIGGKELRPPDDAIIITGRVYSMANGTLEELKQRGITNPVCFNPYQHTHADSAKHKAEIINRMGISFFYEDTPEVYEYLQKNCKNCNLFLVK